METAIMKSLLENFIDEVTLTSDQLTEAKNYLFGEADTISFPEDLQIIETLTYLKEIIDENNFGYLDELDGYFKEKKKRYAKFLWNVTESTEWRENPNQYKPKNANVGDYLNQAATKSIEWDNLIYPPHNTYGFQRYLKTLSIYVREKVTSSLKASISHYNAFSVNLDSCTANLNLGYNLGCYFSGRKKLQGYFEKFSGSENRREIMVWTAKEVQKSNLNNHNLISFDYLNGSIIHKNTNTELALDGTSKLYDNIVWHIQQEKTIWDKSIKEEIVEWLCYSKFHSVSLKSSITLISDLIDTNKQSVITNTECLHSQKHDNAAECKESYKVLLTQKKWRILKSPPGSAWLTSDNPGFGIHLTELFSKPLEMIADGTLNTIRPDTLIYYPLSSDYCLRIQPNTTDFESNHLSDESPIEFEQSTQVEFEIVNRLTFSTKNEIIITRDKESLEQLELI